MNQIQISKPELFFIFEEWADEFRERLLREYVKICDISYSSHYYDPIPTHQDITEQSYEWLYRVCSQEEFGDCNHYENLVLSDDEDGANTFYSDCQNDDFDFRQDVFAVLKANCLSFVTEDGRFHNMPIKEVW
jgi:hypothetical protein